MAARKPILIVLGVVLFGLGAFVAVRPLWVKTPLTGARWLDMAFALVFMLRGAMNVRAAGRVRP
ncbi:MAG TPA: hypothetical protein VF159_00825 [Gemmatimonadaceae bacterium]